MSNEKIDIKDNIDKKIDIVDDKIDINIKTDLNNIVKQKRVRNKKIIYAKERDEILKKIYEILNITAENKTFFSHKFDNEIKNKISELEDEIKIIFSCSNWSIFKKNTFEIKHRELSLVKHVLKELNINFTSKTYNIRDYFNKTYITTTEYVLI